MPLSELLPSVVILGVVMSAAWVYFDEVAQCRRGTPVAFSFGTFHVDTQGAWFGARLFLWMIFFPLYLSGRRH